MGRKSGRVKSLNIWTRLFLGTLIVPLLALSARAEQAPVVGVDFGEEENTSVRLGLIPNKENGLQQATTLLRQAARQHQDLEAVIHTDTPEIVLPEVSSIAQSNPRLSPQLVYTPRPKRQTVTEAWKGQSNYPGFWFFAVSGTQAFYYIFVSGEPIDVSVLCSLMALPLNYFYVVKSDFAFELLVRAKNTLGQGLQKAYDSLIAIKNWATTSDIRLRFSDYVSLKPNEILRITIPSQVRSFVSGARARIKSETLKLLINFGQNSAIAAAFETALAIHHLSETFSSWGVYQDIFVLGGSLGVFLSGTWEAAFLRWEQKAGTSEEVFSVRTVERFYELKNAFMGMLYPLIYSNNKIGITIGVLTGISGMIVSMDINDRIFFQRGAKLLERGSKVISERIVVPAQAYAEHLALRSPTLKAMGQCARIIRNLYPRRSR
jgi:hypothetical protein